MFSDVKHRAASLRQLSVLFIDTVHDRHLHIGPTKLLSNNLINVKKVHGSLTTVVRAQNDTSKTANITDTIFNKKVIIVSSKSPTCRLLQ